MMKEPLLNSENKDIRLCPTVLVVVMVVCYLTPSERWGHEGTPQRVRHPTVRPRPKVYIRSQKWKKYCQRWCAGEVQVQDNPVGDESDPAEGLHRRCKKNSPSVLSCIGKKTREGCDCGSEVWTVHSGWDGEGPVPPRKPKESCRRGSCMKYFVSTKSSEYVYTV